MEIIGLIAGKSEYPILFAKAAKAKGIKVIAVGIEGETREELKSFVDRLHWIKLGEFKELMDIFKGEGIKKAVMIGGITKSRIFKEPLKLDDEMKAVLNIASDKKDETLLSLITSKLNSAGIELLDSTLFLEEYLPEEGVLTSVKPSSSEEEDIRFGFGIAKEIARLDIGLSIVVKDKAVIAVEGIEGTDEMIKRGGKLGGVGTTVIKVARPNQDMRFDIPVVGPRTIRSMIKAKTKCLAIEAKRTLIIDRAETISQAERRGISIVAVKG
ncbi:MAG: UDP-2,3-diacylglucosamine diphosphatase LpxI [Candidatus Omnitrophota bacterium]